MSGRPNPRHKRLVRTRRLSGSDSSSHEGGPTETAPPTATALAWRRRIDMSQAAAAAPTADAPATSKWKRVAVRAVQIQGDEML
jgi:hypothetical protein